eukprot:655328-Hanusia_phi.AAC.1
MRLPLAGGGQHAEQQPAAGWAEAAATIKVPSLSYPTDGVSPIPIGPSSQNFNTKPQMMASSPTNRCVLCLRMGEHNVGCSVCSPVLLCARGCPGFSSGLRPSFDRAAGVRPDRMRSAA